MSDAIIYEYRDGNMVIQIKPHFPNGERRLDFRMWMNKGGNLTRTLRGCYVPLECLPDVAAALQKAAETCNASGAKNGT